MKLFKRIQSIIRGKSDSLPGPFEDPSEELAVFVDELNGQMAGLDKAVAAALADERRLRMDIEDHLAQANEWEGRAVLALEAGDEALAQEALLKKEEHEARSLSLQKAWKGQQAATAKLKGVLQASRQRLSEAEHTYARLLSEDKSAGRITPEGDTLPAGTSDSPQTLMHMLSEKIRKIEAETEAATERSGENDDADLEGKCARLEESKRGTAALEALKAKLAEQGAHP
jgi:phage shock protein A